MGDRVSPFLLILASELPRRVQPVESVDKYDPGSGAKCDGFAIRPERDGQDRLGPRWSEHSAQNLGRIVVLGAVPHTDGTLAVGGKHTAVGAVPDSVQPSLRRQPFARDFPRNVRMQDLQRARRVADEE